MKSFFGEELRKIKGMELKSYYYQYESPGFESGFGKSVIYSGQSHLYLSDIPYSFETISTSDFFENLRVT